MASNRPLKAPSPPRPLPAFAHISQHFDRDLGSWCARILPGQYYVSRNDEMIDTVLGSCVSACLRDPQAGVGGMNHFMLPQSNGTSGNSWLDPKTGLATRYGSFAMESLINDLLKLGAARERLELKLFGGGKILESSIDVGERNAAFAREFARIEGLQIIAQDLGDIYPRKVIYHPLTGRVKVKRLHALDRARIAGEERNYAATIQSAPEGNDVELFD
ncbi:MAG: chemoreceptor glutamine deamidase CheD [Steroidobacteraceae bacterium]